MSMALKHGAVRPANATDAQNADPMMRYTEKRRGAGNGRQALLDMT
jgi:hypothetical protein